MINDKLIYGVSPLHDYYMMFGEKKYRMLRPVISRMNILDDSEESMTRKNFSVGVNPDRVKLDELLSLLSKNALNDDFNSTSLRQDVRFTWRNLTNLPLEKLKNYFGESISLFFYFSNYKIYFSFWIAIFLIITDIIRTVNGGNEVGKKLSQYTILINVIAIIIWNNIFVEVWKRKERL
jgi:Calcium-activated chloride channel